MAEILISIALFLAASAGIGLGAMLGRPPVRTSCGAADRLAAGRCADCPLRRKREEGA